MVQTGAKQNGKSMQAVQVHEIMSFEGNEQGSSKLTGDRDNSECINSEHINFNQNGEKNSSQSELEEETTVLVNGIAFKNRIMAKHH